MKVKYSLMTWNTALTEVSDAAAKAKAKAVFKYVTDFLKDDNTIAVLQQIPYKKRVEVNCWIEDPLYTQFAEAFSEYKVYKNTSYNDGFIRMLTVIVTKMQCEKDAKFITTNREAAVQIESSYSVFGLHAKNGGKNKTYLENLAPHKSDIVLGDFNAEGADIILGDFNAGDYDKCENRDTFKSILEDYVCICNMPTKEIRYENGELERKSCIDHIFVKSGIVDRCSSLVIHEDIKISDHYPITFCIDKAEEM